MYTYFISFWLKLFLYQDLKYKFSKVSTKLQPVSLKLSINLFIINMFLSKLIKKHTNHWFDQLNIG